MATYDLQETYVTKNGARETPTQITGESATISTGTVSYGGYTLKYVELVERPASADGYRPTISGFTETESQNVSVGEFYIDFRTARLYFNENDSGAVSIDYYGYGTVIRNEHINTLQTDLNKVQCRAMVGINNVSWIVGADGTGSVEFNKDENDGTLTVPTGTLYLPPSFDAATHTVAYTGGDVTSFEDGDVIYCPVVDTGSATLGCVAYSTFCNLSTTTDANIVLALRQHDICYLLNGVTLAHGESWTPSDGVASGSGATKYTETITIEAPDTTKQITHGLSQSFVICQVYDDSTPPEIVVPDFVRLDSSTQLTVGLSSFAPLSGYEVVVIG